MAKQLLFLISLHNPVARAARSPNQVLTHAARAAAKQLNKVAFQPPLVAARGAREGLWLEQRCARPGGTLHCVSEATVPI